MGGIGGRWGGRLGGGRNGLLNIRVSDLFKDRIRISRDRIASSCTSFSLIFLSRPIFQRSRPLCPLCIASPRRSIE